MSNIDKGWEYLNSDDNESYYGDDGSYGYTNSDGSKSFSGSDGSYGWKNSDGSISYYGSGSVSGYRNPDGSGTYYGEDEIINYDSFSDSLNPSDTEEDSFIAECLMGLTLIAEQKIENAFAKAMREESEKESIKKELKEARKKERKNSRKIYKKRAKALLFNHKNIPFGICLNDLKKYDAETIIRIIKAKGYKNCNVIPLNDIYVGSSYTDGKIAKMTINGNSKIDPDSEYPYDAEIIIFVHSKKQITMNMSSSKLINKDYQDVVNELFKQGFTNIYTRALNDLTTGWIYRDKSIKEIKINDRIVFQKGERFDYDSRIEIDYHSFKS